jgi:hypothetical protein
MDQIFTVVLTEKVNERVYSLNLPIGAPWSEAIEVTQFFAQAVANLAADSEKQAAERAAAQEPIDVPVEQVEPAVEDVQVTEQPVVEQSPEEA